MRTRMFLRTSEFLWQEGHTAHATAEEAQHEANLMLSVYHDFITNFLAIDPILGAKSENERFAWADETYTLEPMMQDKKALQIGTSHFLGQSFAKAFDVTYTTKDNKKEYVWATSWWVSTRMMGWLIMSHSDDTWLILPPALAPIHLVIIPIFKTSEDLKEISDYLEPLIENLRKTNLTISSTILGDVHIPLNILIDTDDQKSPWWKYGEYELKWVPLRIAVWKRDIESNQFELYRRDIQEKSIIAHDNLIDTISKTLHDVQANLLTKNRKFREDNTFYVDTYEEFKAKLSEWFIMAHRDWTVETELKIKEETKATIRCIPFPEYLWDNLEEGKCIVTGKPSKQRVLFALAY